MEITTVLAQEFKLKLEHVKNIVALIDDGNTIPFIARYRKEMTGSVDDQVLRELNDRLEYLRNLEKRKAEVKESITAQEKMTDELARAIEVRGTWPRWRILPPLPPKRATSARRSPVKKAWAPGRNPHCAYCQKAPWRSSPCICYAEKGVSNW
jgi:uncharacterized protein